MTRLQQVQRTLNNHPALHDGGYGRQRGKELAALRSALMTPASVLAIDNLVCWLSLNIAPTCAINKRHSSYGLKHIYERFTSEYCSNGQFITAALICGYRADFSHYNVAFAMSEKSIKVAWDHAQNMPRKAVTA